MGVIEYWYKPLASRAYTTLREVYGFSHRACLTYHAHAALDEDHGKSSLRVVTHHAQEQDKERITQAVRDGLVASWYHFLGMLEGATGTRWSLCIPPNALDGSHPSDSA